jgi:hypothetical protein
MLEQIMLATGPGHFPDADEKVVLVDTIPKPSGKKLGRVIEDRQLTDESFSLDSDCNESSRSRSNRRESESPEYTRQGFLPLKVIAFESEESLSLNSNEKSIEHFKPKMLIMSSSPHQSKSEDDSKAGFMISGDSPVGFDSKPNVNEKKVPHAPRNLNKINFNFDKGFLADRSEKKAQVVVSQSQIPPLSEDQFTKKMSSLKFKNKNLKLSDIEMSALTPMDQVQLPGVTSGQHPISSKYESSFEEKLRIKDIMISELRAEVDALNYKNRSLISEVSELRDSIVRLETQLEHAYRSNLDHRFSDSKLTGQLKVGGRLNRSGRWTRE